MGPIFRRTLHCSVFWTLVLLCRAWVSKEPEIVNAKAGSSVTLKPSNGSRRSEKVQILWMFGVENPTILIAKVSSPPVPGPAWAQFQGRLHVDQETGDLTISNLNEKDSGIYEQQRIGTHYFSNQFKLMVYSPLSPPSVNMIKSHLGGCRPHKVVCSVENSRNLNLTWFRGNVWLLRAFSLDAARLSLTSSLGQSETRAYICEARNPLEKTSTIFHPNQTCLKSRESSSWSHSELTVRLVVSAVIGLDLMLFLDHLRTL